MNIWWQLLIGFGVVSLIVIAALIVWALAEDGEQKP